MGRLRSLAERVRRPLPRSCSGPGASNVATGWDLCGADRLEALADHAMRFVALRKVSGDEAAISYTEEVIRGPEASTAYVPLMPALMGPDLASSDRGRRLMERLTRRSPE